MVNGIIKTCGAKGKKDRYVQLPYSILNLLRNYYKQEKPQTWLFEGNINTQYSASSLGKIIKQNAQKAGIKKRVYPHILRHSFATHLLDAGTVFRYVQELLGHKNVRTTMIYSHLSQALIDKVESPLDRMARERDQMNIKNNKK